MVPIDYGPRLLLLLAVFLIKMTDALQCLEGSDCVQDASCGECSGVACTRVVSHNIDDNKEVALTCLPYDTRNYHKPQLEEQGCRVIGDRQTCICYSHDYCNSGVRFLDNYLITFLFSISFLIFTVIF